jgi:signal transduction histidine kinase
MALRFPGSLSARITIGFMVLVATFAGISLSTVRNIEVLNRGIRITHAGYLQLALVSGDLDSKQGTLRGYLREELGEEPSERWARKRLQRLLDARLALLTKTEGILRDVRSMEGVSASQFATTVRLVESMRALVDESDAQYKILLAKPPIAGRITDPVKPEYEEVLEAQRTQLRLELKIGKRTDDLKAHVSNKILFIGDRLDAAARDTRIYTLVPGAMAVFLGIMMTIGVILMLRPLKRLREAAGRIASGDYEHRISVEGPTEISELAQEFNVMGQAIRQRSLELVRTERLATAGKMAAMITHEVRNPLSSIGLNTELLEEELAALPADRAEEAQSLCRSITKEVDRLTEITEEYLQLARLPTPKLQPESLERVIRSVVDFVRDQLRSRGVDVELELGEDGPSLALDEAQIRQVLLNLIRNGADAVADQEKGLIRIGVSHTKEGTELVVSDNGSGIPGEIADRIFEAFVSTKNSGTGLGLALTQQIISDHGGTIEVSNADTGGAVFRIKFPPLAT